MFAAINADPRYTNLQGQLQALMDKKLFQLVDACAGDITSSHSCTGELDW